MVVAALKDERAPAPVVVVTLSFAVDPLNKYNYLKFFSIIINNKNRIPGSSAVQAVY